VSNQFGPAQRHALRRPGQITQIYQGTNQIQRMVIARKTFTGVR
jgi:hypothetical protein